MAKQKAIRTPRRFETCPDDVLDLVRQVRREKYPDLDGVTMTCDFAYAPTKDGIATSDDLTHHGHPAGAIIKIVSLKDRVSGHADVILRISHAWWVRHPDQKDRYGLINHELKHIVGTGDEDSHGRPKLLMRHHDYELGGFYDAIEEDKEHSPDLQAIMEVNKQLRERDLVQHAFWG